MAGNAKKIQGVVCYLADN